MKNSKNIALIIIGTALVIVFFLYASVKQAPISAEPNYEATPNVASDFTDYTNTRLGFSMKLPKSVNTMSISTIFDTETPALATTTSVIVLDNGTSNTIYVVLHQDVRGDAYTYARVSDIESLDFSRIPGWALHFVTVKNNTDLVAFAQKFRDPSLCVLGADQTFEKMSDPSKTYNIRLLETPKAEATCDDSDYHILYSPKAGKLVWWNIGNGAGYFGLDVATTTKYTLGKTFDTDMADSFQFLGQ